mmetsp:Transcript_13391/g.20943  ORF Transcript_13391/g.20943 Transcript_13391/m.20943 type:complete len:123 (-) Transcript_13391:116-484(-)
MHIKFLPYTNLTKPVFISHAIGIFFDSKNFDKSVSESQNSTIDDFFYRLGLDIEEREELDFTPKQSIPNFAEIMGAVDWSKKWVYKGSSTQPPCKQHVYWQVLETVYPIKPKYLAGLKFLLT